LRNVFYYQTGGAMVEAGRVIHHWQQLITTSLNIP